MWGVVLITGGRLGDAYGRKRLFLIGVTGFTIMSALCGAAQSPGQLIACRAIQGAMGAIMIPQVLSVIQVMFPARERILFANAERVHAGSLEAWALPAYPPAHPQRGGGAAGTLATLPGAGAGAAPRRIAAERS